MRCRPCASAWRRSRGHRGYFLSSGMGRGVVVMTHCGQRPRRSANCRMSQASSDCAGGMSRADARGHRGWQRPALPAGTVGNGGGTDIETLGDVTKGSALGTQAPGLRPLLGRELGDELRGGHGRGTYDRPTRHPGPAIALKARSSRAGICSQVCRLRQVPDSLGEGLGFQDDGWQERAVYISSLRAGVRDDRRLPERRRAGSVVISTHLW